MHRISVHLLLWLVAGGAAFGGDSAPSVVVDSGVVARAERLLPDVVRDAFPGGLAVAAGTNPDLESVLRDMCARYDLEARAGLIRRESLRRFAGNPKAFSGVVPRRVRISDDPVYRDFAWWSRTGGGPNEALRRPARSAETRSPADHFAVNAALFLSDPDYAVRRPASYEFFRALFRHDPFPGERFALDFPGPPAIRDALRGARIQSVDFVFVDPGASVASRFGHAMLRFAFVRPGAVTPIFVAAAFSAYTDPAVDVWKGLSGGYPSLLSFHAWTDVEDRYAKLMLRDIRCYPLRLDESASRALWNRCAEAYWGYEGRYYFVTANCASELLRLLRGLGPGSPLRPAISPKGVLDQLKRAGWVDAAVDDTIRADPAEAVRRGYLVRSKAEAIASAFAALPESCRGGVERGVDYVLQTSAAERDVIEACVAQRPDAAEAWVGMLYLETLCRQARAAEIAQAVAAAWMGDASNFRELAPDLAAMIEAHLEYRLPVFRGRDLAGYGVPPDAVVAPESESPPDTAARVAMLVGRMFPEAWQELQRTENRIAGLRKQLAR